MQYKILLLCSPVLLFGCSTTNILSRTPEPDSRSDTQQTDVRARLAGFLNLNLYVIETVTVSPKLASENLGDHLDYQIELEKDGILFGAGPLYDAGEERPSAGLIIVRAASLEQAKTFADADPMHKTGARRYSIRRWKLNEGAINLTVRYSDQSVAID